MPFSEPSYKLPLMIMIRTNRVGIGTVIHTIYDELLTPLNTQKKIIIQTAKHAPRAVPANLVGSPSSYSLQSSSTDLITFTLKNCSARETSSISHVQSLSVYFILNDHGSGLKNATTT